MKTKALILVLVMSLGVMVSFYSCNNDDESCPEGTWDSYEDCMDAKQAAGSDLCECETEGTTGKWFMVYDP